MRDVSKVEFETVEELYSFLREHSPETIILENMEDALVGVLPVATNLCALVYLKSAVIDGLQRQLEISYDDAVTYFDTHLIKLWEQHKNPCFIERIKGGKKA